MQGGKDAKSPEALVYPRDGPWVSNQFSLQAPANTEEKKSLQVLSPSGFLNANGKFCQESSQTSISNAVSLPLEP